MFKYRIVSFSCLLGLFIYIFWGGRAGFELLCAVAAIMTFLAVVELGRMLENLDMNSFKYGGGIFSAIFLYLYMHTFYLSAGTAAAAVAIPLLVGWGVLLIRNDFALTAKKLAVTLGVCMMTLPMMMALGAIGAQDLKLLAYLVLVTKSGDTGAYCIGMLSNLITKGKNHPVAPRISPKKSIEGTVGGLLFSIGVSFLLGGYFMLINGNWMLYLLFGIVLFWGGFFGDLTESVLKRGCRIKDSGSLLPGMGGVWDVMDSFIYNGIVFYLLLVFLLAI